MEIIDKFFFEVVPPLRSSSAERQERILHQVKRVLEHLPHISHINIPEVVDENFRGEPYYKHVDVAKFGQDIKKSLGLDVILNKVVVHLKNPEALVAWVNTCHSELNLSGFVWVGGNSSKFSYAGPSVLEANRLIQSIQGVRFGNILIPTRKNELEKMIEKTGSGCSFFTTQVLFDKNGLCDLLTRYERACRGKGLQPCRIYLSFAPAANSQNLEFLRWLGVRIHDDVLRNLTRGDIAKNSVRLSADVFNEICEELKGSGLAIGLNVEHISQNNFELAIALGKELTRVIA